MFGWMSKISKYHSSNLLYFIIPTLLKILPFIVYKVSFSIIVSPFLEITWFGTSPEIFLYCVIIRRQKQINNMAAARFSSRTEDEIAVLRTELNAKSTITANKRAAATLRSYLSEKNQPTDFENFQNYCYRYCYEFQY